MSARRVARSVSAALTEDARLGSPLHTPPPADRLVTAIRRRARGESLAHAELERLAGEREAGWELVVKWRKR